MIITVDVAEIGARVDVPACVAVTEQFPALSKLRVEPVIEQTPVEVVAYVMTPPPDAAAVKVIDLLEIFAVELGVKVIVCASLVISKVDLKRSDAK